MQQVLAVVLDDLIVGDRLRTKSGLLDVVLDPSDGDGDGDGPAGRPDGAAA